MKIIIHLMFLIVANYVWANDALDYSKYSSLLEKYVDAKAKVDYVALKLIKSDLQKIVSELNNLNIADAPRAEALAYWINIYNANTLLLIVNHYPLKSIMDLDGGKTWDVQNIVIGNKKYSLNQIENEIIRPQFKDPRIHFALNCSAVSCPPLLNKAYTGQEIDKLLDTQTKSFLMKSVKQKSDTEIEVSSLFDWYSSDFGDVKKFIAKYFKDLGSSVKIQFTPYDWALNGK